ADVRAVVPDHFTLVRGGVGPVPPAGDMFSCAAGPTPEAAACAVPNNQLRFTTAGAVRAAGGIVEWVIEFSRRGTMNKQHVNVTEAGSTSFGEPQPNPVPKPGRIDQGK